MKLELTKKEKTILNDILLEELQRIGKYQYLIFTDKRKFEKYQNTVCELYHKLL